MDRRVPLTVIAQCVTRSQSHDQTVTYGEVERPGSAEFAYDSLAKSSPLNRLRIRQPIHGSSESFLINFSAKKCRSIGQRRVSRSVNGRTSRLAKVGGHFRDNFLRYFFHNSDTLKNWNVAGGPIRDCCNVILERIQGLSGMKMAEVNGNRTHRPHGLHAARRL